MNLLPLIQHNANIDFISPPAIYLQDVRSTDPSIVSSRWFKPPLRTPRSEVIQNQLNSPLKPCTILFDSLQF